MDRERDKGGVDGDEENIPLTKEMECVYFCLERWTKTISMEKPCLVCRVNV